MIQSILAAVDGSESSLAGLRYAADWAAQLKLRLDAVFVEEEQRFLTYAVANSSITEAAVYPVPLSPEKMEAEQRRVEQERKAIEAEFRKASDGRVPGARFTSIPGATNDVLVREARTADLVVMGKRGHFEPIDSTRAGPTTEILIHEAIRPVVVVPDKSRTRGPLLMAFDDSAGAQRVLPVAAELADRLGIRMIVLTVDDKPERAQKLHESVKSFLRGHAVSYKLIVERGKAAEVILRTAHSEQAGLIAMGAFGRNPVYELFFGSVTLSVLHRATCPILLMG